MLQPAETSYFSTPAAGLDPRLFQGGKLRPNVRNSILKTLLNYVDSKFTGSSGWLHAWLAGSGVSYQWSAQRDPGDLDCLVGVDFALFRESNPTYRGLSNKELAKTFNDGFYNDLQPTVERFMGSFELTFYVNTQTNILDIKPYAAYSLTDDAWTVAPAAAAPEVNPAWEVNVEKDRILAVNIMSKYLTAKTRYEQASNDAVRANSRAEMRITQSQAINLYDEIHALRADAFSDVGEGYSDYNNYRWQAGKRTGVIQALRHIKEVAEEEVASFSRKTYGVELPESDVLVRRAATQYAR
jgi:hypothetical protein